MRIAFAALSLMTACISGTTGPGKSDGGGDGDDASALEEAKKEVPPGSGDYSAILADGILYQRGKISFGELSDRILARKLPPHPLGDGYLEMTPPPPPNPDDFNPRMMPSDWVGTWGEVRQLAYSGKITEAQYVELHAKAHPDCKKP